MSLMKYDSWWFFFFSYFYLMTTPMNSKSNEFFFLIRRKRDDMIIKVQEHVKEIYDFKQMKKEAQKLNNHDTCKDLPTSTSEIELSLYFKKNRFSKLF